MFNIKMGVAIVTTMTIFGCDVNQTEEGSLPDVSVEGGNIPSYKVVKTEKGEMPDVNVKGGNMPEFEVDMAEVEVKTKTKTIEVEVPDVDIVMPDEKEK